MELIGSVKGKNVMIIDDMVDTCGTLKKAVSYLKAEGALKVYYIATHPVLSGEAFTNLVSSELDELIISDTVLVDDIEGSLDYAKIFLQYESDDFVSNNLKVHQVSCVPVLEKVIINLINDESISELNNL